jgi:hypothetical protein
MSLETPNRLRACGVLLLDTSDAPNGVFTLRSQNGEVTNLTSIQVAEGDNVADMTIQNPCNNDEGIALATGQDPNAMNVGAWVTPTHTTRGGTLDAIPVNHLCVEALHSGKPFGWRVNFALFVVQTEVTPIEGEPIAAPPPPPPP